MLNEAACKHTAFKAGMQQHAHAATCLFFVLRVVMPAGIMQSYQDDAVHITSGEWTGSKGEVLGALMQAQIARQSKLPQAVLEFYQSSVPAVPLLLMGLVCLEGKELVSLAFATCLPEHSMLRSSAFQAFA